jgi:hypothetical protein
MVDAFWLLMRFFLAMWPAIVLVIALHETGHALAARAAGMTVFSWGVGNRKIFLRIPVGRSIFYLAWPLSGGLTLWAPPSLDPRPMAQAIAILGGLLANAVGLLAGIAAFALGWKSEVVAAWVLMSAYYVLLNATPFYAMHGGVKFRSDGLVLLELVRRRSPTGRLGSQLARARVVINLLERIEHPAGIAYWQLYAAILEATLANIDQARRDLALGEVPAGASVACTAQLLAVARLEIAGATNDDRTPELVEQTRAAFSSVGAIQFVADCTLANWRLARGLAIEELLDKIRKSAQLSAKPGWLEFASRLEFLSNPSNTPDLRCRQILSEHRSMSELSRIGLLTAASKQLAKLGRSDDARQIRDEALAATAREAVLISSPETRAAFIACERRQMPAFPDENADEPMELELPVQQIRVLFYKNIGKNIYALLTLFFGVVALILGSSACLERSRLSAKPTTPDFERYMAASCFVLALLMALGSMVRRERSTPLVAIGLALALIGIVLFVFAA